MPSVEEIMTKLSRKRYLSQFDATNGFLQIPVAESSRENTAFSTPQGHYEFYVSPLGLLNSPAVWNRRVRRAMDGLKNTDSFVDDLIVHTDTWEDHIKCLRVVPKSKKMSIAIKTKQR